MDLGVAGSNPASHPNLLPSSSVGAVLTTKRPASSKLIVRVLADAGPRVTELTGLRPTDLIERDRGVYVRFRGKGDRERDVPVMPQLGRRLRRHASCRRAESSSEYAASCATA